MFDLDTIITRNETTLSRERREARLRKKALQEGRVWDGATMPTIRRMVPECDLPPRPPKK